MSRFDLEIHLDNGEILHRNVESVNHELAVYSVFENKVNYSYEHEGRYYFVPVEKIAYIVAKKEGESAPKVGYA